MRWASAAFVGLAAIAAPWACIDISGASNATAAGSGGGSASGAGGSGAPVSLLAGQDCDPLVPTQCGFPFPSNVWLVDDKSTKTGKRVQFGKTTLPLMKGVGNVDPALVGDSDGFSTGQAPMTHLPGATVTGLPTQFGIAASLDPKSPTVILEADAGKPVPHWAEIDANTEAGDEGALMLRPAVRLKDATRYLVAIRHVVDKDGKAIAPTPVFQALRDGGDSTDPTVAPRRALYQDILGRLAKAGYDPKDLQIAWDFTTASRDNNTRWMLHMRDVALATVGKLGPEYTVTDVEENPNPHIRRRITGKMKVPLYLDQPGPGAKLVFGADGLPKQNGTAEYDFIVHVPNSALKSPAGLLQNGHGLLGSMHEGQNGYLAQIADAGNFVAFSVPLIGMAAEDQPQLQKAIALDFHAFRDDVDRQHQGIINSLLAMRMMSGRFADDPNVKFDGKSVIDGSKRYYRGDSQGGIFGCSYMALTTDVERGLLGEPGMPYNLLLNRSRDFDTFFVVLKAKFQSMRDVQIVLGIAQMLWDRTEPNGYCPYVTDDTLPGTPSHKLLIHAAIGDYQVTPLGAEVIARAIGAKNMTPANRDVFGLQNQDAPYDGNALVEFDFGLPPVPAGNVPPTGTGFPDDGDPHDKVRVLDAAVAQSVYWLHQGTVIQTCSGKCDPE